ncbi:MAG: 16S rRNA (guanine(966)-N(2))-methyltransferase RsmD [Candidatus Caldatribacterium sp.]|uniref:16S rRNA (guanine(966)-N(2))-methyltransferase RsmD n=1 Tax=Candidatus Caldatribacterium sp. TaxID=2282143 RepID=UPI00299475F1|nr:16S rRNA (guanine(966)-N(2))-methyltransferase RsmD [Candidatus Caldatribacterium sp.]MCX7731468.1 16S rRNA (guanine(966)-N(2))-methyltransferase RsmD [Candidatus Caldatribacterium sp.]MDW8080501.1 16S rRNA (guanine(966)-N(2))-methyltransferase RsmD [Candidatus Calescibacterium sp.]
MGYIHIVGGEKKGKKIIVPPGGEVRPIQGVVRKALFEILKDDLLGSVVYDIFAGSGSLGLEALSRGARKAYFFEGNPRVCQILRRNIALCGYEDRAQVVRFDFWQARKFPRHLQAPDIVFLDPPFMYDISEVVEKLYNFKVVIGDALVVLRSSRKNWRGRGLPFLELLDVRRYGKSVLLFGRLRSPEAEGLQ